MSLKTKESIPHWLSASHADQVRWEGSKSTTGLKGETHGRSLTFQRRLK